MSEQYYNRYGTFLIDGIQTTVPYVSLNSKSSDKVYIYKKGFSRLDKISQTYYDTPYFGWLILMANPQFGGLEWNIEDGSILIVPFTLLSSLQDYKIALDNHFFYYGR